MADTVLSIRLQADGSDLVDEIKLSRQELERLGQTGARTGRSMKRSSGDIDRVATSSSGAAKGTTKVAGGLRAMGAQAALITGPLGGVASRFSVLATLVSKVNPLMIAFSAATAVSTLALGKATKAAAEHEKQLATLNALVSATGGVAGLSAPQIDAFAFSLAKATLASTQGVREAAGQLLTFKSISGETFTRTLELAQDLSAVGFGDLRGAAVQLGKALEDPTLGLSALRRVGVSFTASQQKLIKSLNDTGRSAEAQTIILDVLESQVGGAGVAQAGGLSGAVDSLAGNWVQLMEEFGKSGPAKVAADAMNALASGVEAVRKAAFPTLLERILDLQEKVKTRSRARGRVPGGLRDTQDRELLDLSIQRTEDSNRTLLRGVAARSRQAAERSSDIAAEAVKTTGVAIDKLQDKLNAFKAGPVATEIAGYREALAEVEKGLIAVGVGQEKFDEVMTRARDVVAALSLAELERSGALEARQTAIREATIGARELARADKDLAATIKQDVMTPMENYTAAVAELDRLQRKGAVTQDTYNRRIAQLDEELRDATGETERFRKAQEAATRALEKQQRVMQRPFLNAISGIQTAFTDMFENVLSGGIRSFSDFAGAVKQVFIRLAAEIASLMVFRPILGGVLGAGGFGNLAQSLGVGAPGGSTAGGLGGFGNLGSLFSGAGSAINSFGASLGFASSFPAGAASAAGVAPVAGGLTNAGGTVGGFFGSGATLGASLGAAGFGALAGNFLGPLFGLNQTGSTIGGGLGAGIGFAVGGPIGGVIGGLLGGVGGGLFGNNRRSVGPVASATLTPQDGRFAIAGIGTDNGGSAALGRRIGESAAAAINAVLEDIGGRVTGGAQFANISAVGGRFRTRVFGQERFFADAERAIEDLVLNALKGGTDRGFIEGLSPEIQSVFRNTEATTLAGLSSDIAFVRAFSDSSSQLEQALDKLGNEFEDMRERAERFGVSLEKVADAEARATRALVDQFLPGVRQLLDSLTLGPLAGASAADVLAARRASFEASAAQALTGNAGAQGEIAALIRAFIDASRAFFASGPGFQTDLVRAQDVLRQLLAPTGFMHGGSFMVGGFGGADSQLVSFRASPDERVTIDRGANDNGVVGAIRDMARQQARADADLRNENDKIIKHIDRLNATVQRQQVALDRLTAGRIRG